MRQTERGWRDQITLTHHEYYEYNKYITMFF